MQENRIEAIIYRLLTELQKQIDLKRSINNKLVTLALNFISLSSFISCLLVIIGLAFSFTFFYWIWIDLFVVCTSLINGVLILLLRR